MEGNELKRESDGNGLRDVQEGEIGVEAEERVGREKTTVGGKRNTNTTGTLLFPPSTQRMWEEERRVLLSQE